MESLITIIMPVYNAEKFLDLSISSVLNQTFKKFKLLIIDDGSTDKSFEIISKYEKLDNRVKYIKKENDGVCAARNLGLSLTDTKYVTFIDHDDEYKEDFLENNIKLLEEKELDLVKCARANVFVDLNGEKWGEKTFSFGDKIYKKDELILDILNLRKSEIWGSVWNGVYKTDLFKVNNIVFNENYRNGNEDVDILVDILFAANKIGFSSYVGYQHYYRMGQSTSLKFNKNQISTRLEVISKEKKMISNYGLKQLEDKFIIYDLLDCFKILSHADSKEVINSCIRDIDKVINRKKILNRSLKKELFDLSKKNYIELRIICSSFYMYYFNIKRLIKR